MKTATLACLASLIALPAMADRNPQPKPSGITIHLFGPNLITTSNPSSDSSASGEAASGQGAGQSATINGTSAAQPEPTMSEVLHEMFVTGDPADKGKAQFPRGKAASK